MEKVLTGELALLGDTVASDAFVEVVPAPGVQVLGVEGGQFAWGGEGSLRIPLGALHAGQHREALVRVRVTPSAAQRGDARPLASVRLRFHDPSDFDLERVQEVVARAAFSEDAALVSARSNAHTQAIAAVQKAAKLELAASDAVSRGDFHAAETHLAQAESALRTQAAGTKDRGERARLAGMAGSVAGARASATAVHAAPKPAQREEALKMNSAAMDALGY
jgi:Ca-activated chloride channel family protein